MTASRFRTSAEESVDQKRGSELLPIRSGPTWSGCGIRIPQFSNQIWNTILHWSRRFRKFSGQQTQKRTPLVATDNQRRYEILLEFFLRINTRRPSIFWAALQRVRTPLRLVSGTKRTMLITSRLSVNTIISGCRISRNHHLAKGNRSYDEVDQTSKRSRFCTEIGQPH